MNDNTRHPVLYRDAALADGRSDRLRLGVSILVEGDRIESLVAAGLEPWEALGAATWRGGDPLVDPAALWRVWRVAWAPDPLAV